MIEHEKKFAKFVYDLLADDDDDEIAKGVVSLREFEIEWAQYGMLVAVYNLGWMRAKAEQDLEAAMDVNKQVNSTPDAMVNPSTITTGRIVRYKMIPDGTDRVAIVTMVHNQECVNLFVLLDGSSDYKDYPVGMTSELLTSIMYGKNAGQWRWAGEGR